MRGNTMCNTLAQADLMCAKKIFKVKDNKLRYNTNKPI